MKPQKERALWNDALIRKDVTVLSFSAHLGWTLFRESMTPIIPGIDL